MSDSPTGRLHANEPPLQNIPYRRPYHKHTLTRSYYVTTTPPVLGRACLECGLEQEQRPDKKTGHPVWTTTKEGSDVS